MIASEELKGYMPKYIIYDNLLRDEPSYRYGFSNIKSHIINVYLKDGYFLLIIVGHRTIKLTGGNMAAIAGIYSINGEVNGSTEGVEGMLHLMRHRGPDNIDVRTIPFGKGALGAVGINLTPVKTPCTELANSPYILLDGEIHNQRESGKSDIDVFREYYIKYGKDCFAHIEGGFTCAILDGDEVILARDPVGSAPLFYWQMDGVLYFSTEMKGLIDYCRYEIAELPPCHYYSTVEGLKQFKPFLPGVPEPGDDLKKAAAILRELLIEAVEKRMEGVNAVSLSGGLDSSIIAVIAKKYKPDIKLFTVTIDSSPGPDLENAKIMADFLELEHYIYRITDEDLSSFITEGIWYLESFDEDCISGIISNFFASRIVKEYSDIVLVGEGADELFGGYRMVLKNPSVKNNADREKLAKRLLDIAYNTALRRLDRAWMANAVKYREPFLDAKVVAYSQKIPMSWKIYGDKQVEKFILREAFRDMLPEKIANREKLRFAMGVGTDDVMDGLISKIINPEEIKQRPKTYYGLHFASFKELYYYDEFLKLFPPSYEKQTVRWDPFK
jgi:asparagine synthase (glutamine-hydrolysing)